MPHSQIKLYDTSDVLQHTLDDEALSIHTRNILTSGVGTFNFTLPTEENALYPYSDVALNWRIHVYIADGTPTSSDEVFSGKILKITGPLSTDQGYLRLFEGKSLGEILERRFKTNKRYQAVEADDIALEVATDLSIGSDLAVDTTAETLTVRTESYFDLLRKVSDYWFNAGVQVKKDFYVDFGDAGHPNGHLVWKARPIRTSGVETLTVGDNITSYSLLRDQLPIKNYITVYGAPYSYYPSDRDDWTENDSTNWTDVVGTTIHNCVTSQVGSFSVQSEGVANPVANEAIFYKTHNRVSIRDINAINFWHRQELSVNTNAYIRLLAPDTSNYFQSPQLTLNPVATWHYETFDIGPSNTYDATYNPNGQWVVTANANWWDIQGVYFFYAHAAATDVTDFTDGLHYSGLRFSDTASDAASQTAYGRRDAEFTDENLFSDVACEVRANTLLYQLKDPVLRLDVMVDGNNNILIGDRIAMTLAAEGISAQNFDVVAVTHDWMRQAWTTQASMVDSGEVRRLPPRMLDEAIANQISQMRWTVAELYSRFVT